MKAIEKYYNKDNDKVIQNGASVMSMDEAGKLFENKGGSFYEDATVEEKNLVKQIISQNPHILDDIKDPKNDNSLEQFGQFLKKEFYFAGERIDILYTDGAGHVDSIYINDNFVAGLEYEDTNGNYVADYEDEEW